MTSQGATCRTGSASTALPTAWCRTSTASGTVLSELEVEISEPIIDRLCGHEAKGSTGAKVYSHHKPETLRKAVETLSFPKLPRVFPHPTPASTGAPPMDTGDQTKWHKPIGHFPTIQVRNLWEKLYNSSAPCTRYVCCSVVLLASRSRPRKDHSSLETAPGRVEKAATPPRLRKRDVAGRP